MITIGLDFKIFGNGRGLGAPFFDQPFYRSRVRAVRALLPVESE